MKTIAEKRKAKQKSRSYRIVPLHVRAALLAFSPLVLIFTLGSGWFTVSLLFPNPAVALCTGGAFVIMVGALLAIWFMAVDNRLTVLPEGIAYRYTGARCFVKWDDMIAFGWKTTETDRFWGIRFDEFAPQPEGFYSNRFKTIVPLNLFIDMYGFTHPQRANLDWFQRTRLGQDIYRYAPHLFDVPDMVDDMVDEEMIY